MLASRFCRRARPAALASALFFAFGASAWAGPGGHHGAFMGGPGGHGAHVEQVIAHYKAQLDLNPSQLAAFDQAVEATKALRASMRAEFDKLHAAATVELAQPAPNLRTLAAEADKLHAKAQAERGRIRELWLALYDTFSTEQKQVVRDALAKRMERMEHFREKMRSRFG